MSVSWLFIQRGKAWACGAVLFLRPVLLVSPDLADPASVPLSLPCSSLLTLGGQTEPDGTAAVIGGAEGVVRAGGTGLGWPHWRAGGGGAVARTEGGRRRAGRVSGAAGVKKKHPYRLSISKLDASPAPAPTTPPSLAPHASRPSRRHSSRLWAIAAAGIDRVASARHLCCGVGASRSPSTVASSTMPQAQPMTAAPRALASHERSGGGGQTRAQRGDGGGRGWWTTGAACRRRWVDDRNRK
jgi:hypothetical protein